MSEERCAQASAIDRYAERVCAGGEEEAGERGRRGRRWSGAGGATSGQGNKDAGGKGARICPTPPCNTSSCSLITNTSPLCLQGACQSPHNAQHCKCFVLPFHPLTPLPFLAGCPSAPTPHTRLCASTCCTTATATRSAPLMQKRDSERRRRQREREGKGGQGRGRRRRGPTASGERRERTEGPAGVCEVGCMPTSGSQISIHFLYCLFCVPFPAWGMWHACRERITCRGQGAGGMCVNGCA